MQSNFQKVHDWEDSRTGVIRKLGYLRHLVKDAAIAHSNPHDVDSDDNALAEYISKVSLYIVSVQKELSALKNPHYQEEE